MIIDKAKVLNALLVGAVTALGEVAVHESYKMYEAIDPFYEHRFKLGARKRKKIFDNLMAQTNLKTEQA